MRHAFRAALIVVVGCATTQAEVEPKEPAGSEMAPTPFTVEQIRAACGDGRVDVHRITTPRGTIVRRTTFKGGDAEKTTFEIAEATANGMPAGQPRTATARWEELRKHAEYPAASTTMTQATLIVPAGTFDTRLYTVRGESEDGKLQVSRAWFAPSLPGPPVRYQVDVDDETVFDMVLVEHTPAE